MNPEERDALAQVVSNRIQHILGEKEDLENLLIVLGKPILDTKKLQYDAMKVVTRQTEGSKGYYLKAIPEDNQNNRDFELLIEDLKQHNGKLTKQGYFCWLFDDQKTAGMKPSKK